MNLEQKAKQMRHAIDMMDHRLHIRALPLLGLRAEGYGG